MRTIGLLSALCVAGSLLMGCEKSAVEEQKDVIDAEAEAAKQVLEEQEDVREAAEEGAANVAEERREADAAENDE
jgi:VIT1/CCC1 family predicted Fe2+/Mn2+ transporter